MAGEKQRGENGGGKTAGGKMAVRAFTEEVIDHMACFRVYMLTEKRNEKVLFP